MGIKKRAVGLEHFRLPPTHIRPPLPLPRLASSHSYGKWCCLMCQQIAAAGIGELDVGMTYQVRHVFDDVAT